MKTKYISAITLLVAWIQECVAGGLFAFVLGSAVIAFITLAGQVIHQATDKRATITAPPGVPQYNFDMCSEDLAKLKTAGTSVVHTTIESNGILLAGVPSTCMVLAGVIAGDSTLGPHPIPMGADSLQYNNLSQEEYNVLLQAFTAV